MSQVNGTRGKRRIIVAVTGASGAIYGARMLQLLHGIPDVETHAIVTTGARKTLAYETDVDPVALTELADVVHRENDLAASISSGSFRTDGMVVAPCSIKTLSAIANGYSADLVSRAADVTLKERRPLVLMVRETPLHLGHLRLLRHVAEAGAVVMPPVPAFYGRPQTLADLIDHTVGRALDQLGLDSGYVHRWSGTVSDAALGR